MVKRRAVVTEELEIIATLSPMHPGEILREEFLAPLGLSAGKIAKARGVPRTRIERIMREKLGISGDTAVRLGRFFGTSPEFRTKAVPDKVTEAPELIEPRGDLRQRVVASGEIGARATHPQS
jgi:addiction module HigA family antidote